MKVNPYRELDVWKKGIEIVRAIYEATQTFPKEETYGLVAQIRRAAVSIPSNVAEGFRRHYNSEFKQFLYIALGSCAEVETQLSLSSEFNYIDASTEHFILELTDHFCRMTRNLIRALEL